MKISIAAKQPHVPFKIKHSEIEARKSKAGEPELKKNQYVETTDVKA